MRHTLFSWKNTRDIIPRYAFSCVLFLHMASLSPLVVAAGPELSQSAIAEIEALLHEKASRTPGQHKIDSRLLMAIKRVAGDPLFNAVPNLRTGRKLSRSQMQQVDIRAEVSPALLDVITAVGGSVINAHPEFKAIRATIPLSEIEFIAEYPEVQGIRPADEFLTNKNTTSEGVIAHAADTVHGSFDGTGTQTCVLSDAVDTLAARQASGDLPGTVNILAGQAGTGGDEGTAMLEIVFDMAPATDLWFATAFGGQGQFAQNILDLATAGCDIIVDDIFYFAEPVFQDGVISQAVNTVVDAGVQYYASAGNAGNLNDGTSGVWEGDYTAAAAPAPVAAMGYASAHDFGSGSTSNTITADPPFAIALQWSDPSGESANDYDLLLLNPSNTTVFAVSNNTQDGTQNPFEIIDSGSFNDVNNNLVVAAMGSPAPRFLHLNTMRGRLNVATTGQTAGHGAAEKAVGVAAVSAFEAAFPFDGSESVETFSSDGPRRIFYEPDGTPITPGDFLSGGGRLLMKPDITAADGVATDAPSFNPFFGTSAAAPHVAGIAALLLDESPDLTVEGTRFLFSATALDIEVQGPDRDSGYGIVMADDATAAVNPACSGVAPTLAASVVSQALTCTGSTSVTVGATVLVDNLGQLTVITPLAAFDDFRVATGGVLMVQPTP